jgi:hypothetical protein
VSDRWRVRGLPLETFNTEGGSKGEPFAAIQLKSGTIILTKEPYFYEGDERLSSVHEENMQMERERG